MRIEIKDSNNQKSYLKPELILRYLITDDDEMSTSHKELAKTFGVSYPNTKIIIKNRIIARKSIEEWDKEKFLMEIEKIG